MLQKTRTSAFSPLALLLLGAATASAQTSHPGAHIDPAHSSHSPTHQRQAEVAQRGQEVMPFRLAATVHVFNKTPQGGVQQVVVRQPDETRQMALTRQHLKEIRAQFLQGNFSGPTRIHGADMPGLAELRAAAPGQLAIAYRDIAGGAELTYSAANPTLVGALHRWFDAQLADHGKDAMAGHSGHTGHGGHRHHADTKKP